MTKPFKFSSVTLQVLKNFSGINPSIYFQEGNVLTTLSNEKTSAAQALIEEEIPVSFGIWDLSSFLASINLFSIPVMEFNENGRSVTITEGNKDLPSSSLEYFFTDPSIITYPTGNPHDNFPAEYYEFNITEEELSKLIKSAPVVKASSLVLKTTKNGNVLAYTKDLQNTTSNSFNIEIEADLGSKADFELHLDLNHLRIIQQDYRVRVSQNIVEFHATQSKKRALTYWVAVATSSQWS